MANAIDRGDTFEMWVPKHKTNKSYGSAVLVIPKAYRRIIQIFVNLIRPKVAAKRKVKRGGVDNEDDEFVFLKWNGNWFNNSGKHFFVKNYYFLAIFCRTLHYFRFKVIP